MFKIFIILFRESLEIAILLGIFFAIARNIKNLKFYVILGVSIGSILSIILSFIIYGIQFVIDDEYLNLLDAVIILCTSGFITWTVVWIQDYSKFIQNNLILLSSKAHLNFINMFIFVFIVAFTIFREGAEIVLFVYGTMTSVQIALYDCILGIILGALAGGVLGIAIQYGLLKISVKYVFRVSSTMLVLIASGLSAEAAGILTSSGIVNIFTSELWNSSWLIDHNSVFGKIFAAVTGYDAKPNALQLIFYFCNMIITIFMINIRSRKILK
ncbi:FTR1 family iron permease [Rickettsia endosymbiont of Cardiosporidium cionae]|uniref:FTR1 family iron permease n=1 Tax=Rickettsia endosymbiont of Cardiosporidium cionae TaxID=2777155 RepID=UPI00189480AE|nr:FTR1 family protein [Rickettsia endosymbiont of Cardiosporidium cionae]KAF8818823.1 hypothetical protein IHI24_000057 [Rickettsia endosymbiont of Cardiosporidium cionae]